MIVPVRSLLAAVACTCFNVQTAALQPTLPSSPLVYGFFTAQFSADGTFSLTGEGWPTFSGTWKTDGSQITLSTPAVRDCDAPGRYRVSQDDNLVRLTLVADPCTPRRMILDRSAWRRAGTDVATPERVIVARANRSAPPLPAAAPAKGSWPSFRGPLASGVADDQHLPDTWDVKTGANILWHTAVPGLGHSSPVVGVIAST